MFAMMLAKNAQRIHERINITDSSYVLFFG